MAEIKEDRAQCERIFKRFDANGDGKISWTELAEALNALGIGSPEEVRRRMAEIDKDGDGYISIDELCQFQCAHPDLMNHVFNKI